MAETDKTIANLLGDRFRVGWIAQLREEFFGPEGNDEIEKMVEEAKKMAEKMAAASKSCDEKIKEALRELRTLNETRVELDALRQRVERMKSALGQKVAHV